MTKLWAPRDFVIGHSFRDASIPVVSQHVIDTLFSPLNLSIPWGWEFIVEEEDATPKMKEDFQQYLESVSEMEREGYNGSFVGYQIKKEGGNANIIGQKIYHLAPIDDQITIPKTGAKVPLGIGCFLADEDAIIISVEKEKRQFERKEREEENNESNEKRPNPISRGKSLHGVRPHRGRNAGQRKERKTHRGETDYRLFAETGV